MQHTSSGRKYHPCPSTPIKAPRTITLTLSVTQVVMIVIAIIAAALRLAI